VRAGLLLVTLMTCVATPLSAAPRCDGEATAARRAWQVTGDVRRQPPATDGREIRHWATSTLGVWVIDVASADVTLTRVSPETVTTVTFDAACVATRTEQPRPAQAAPRFSDGDLRARLAEVPRGVIVVWSPHMPLSLDAVRAVGDAAATRGLAVDVVLDDAADRDFAARTLVGQGLPAGWARVADSVELVFRDVLVHAPAVQLYARGRLVGSAFPGAHTAAEYGAVFDRVLASVPR